MMKWTLDKAAKELGIHHETLAKGLVRAGLAVERGSRFSTLDIFRGFQGDLKTEQTRKTRAEADAKELENRVRLRELIPMAEAAEMTSTVAAVCRAELNGLVGLASRLTPHSPATSKPILEEYRDKAINNINACLLNKQSNS